MSEAAAGSGRVEEPPEPAPAVVEWGTERRGRIDLFAGVRWQPALPLVLAGLGAVAMVGSLVGEWQVVTLDPELFGPEAGTVTVSVGETLSWGAAWMIGALLLAVATGLALVGQPGFRPAARSVGLLMAGLLLGILVAAAIALDQGRGGFLALYVAVGEDGSEFGLGRGVYAAFASVVLLGAALYLARVPVPAEVGEPAPVPPQPPAQRAGPDPGGPVDLSVAPAEPFSHLTDEQEWR